MRRLDSGFWNARMMSQGQRGFASEFIASMMTMPGIVKGMGSNLLPATSDSTTMTRPAAPKASSVPWTKSLLKSEAS